MHYFTQRSGELHCEEIPLQTIAEQVGTPAYVYSHATLTRHYRVFDEALEGLRHLICYSAKANTNQAILSTLARLGSGADVVSSGELMRVRRAGIPADRIVFSGVGKTATEIAHALDEEILLFNVESPAELHLISEVAVDRGSVARIALRVNPDVDAQTHPYIATGLKESKFGIALSEARAVYDEALSLPGIEVRGVDCHIGSQLTSVAPLAQSLTAVLDLTEELIDKGVPIDYLDIGGGLGIPYAEEKPPSPAEYGETVASQLQARDLDLTLICEPGRVLMGNAGILLTRVIRTKMNGTRRFVVVDAAMNDLMRPALYKSFHGIEPVVPRTDGQPAEVDVVGPICESGDFFAIDRTIAPVETGDLLAIMSAGAYGFVMASNYNSRPRPAEVLVKGDSWAIVRERESVECLIEGESVPNWV